MVLQEGPEDRAPSPVPLHGLQGGLVTESYHLPGQAQMFCPCCQFDLTFVKVEAGSQSRGPQAGDNSVCFNCMTYLKYSEPEPGQLRLDEIKEPEFDAMAERYQIPLMRVKAELMAAKEQGQEARPSRFDKELYLELMAVKQRLSYLESARCGCDYCKGGDSLNCTRRRRA